MAYWIMLFSQHQLGRFSKEDLVNAISAANFTTLSTQYGLDLGLIQPAMDYLAVETAENARCPLFFLRYQPLHQPPIIVSEWSEVDEVGARLLADVVTDLPTASNHSNLENVRFIYGIELLESQLSDMGLLLGYEIARWVMEQVGGIMLGLDREWYRLNPYQAFVPLMKDAR